MIEKMKYEISDGGLPITTCKYKGKTVAGYYCKNRCKHFKCNHVIAQYVDCSCSEDTVKNGRTRCPLCNSLGTISSCIDETNAITIWLECETCGKQIGEELRVEAKDYGRFIEELDKIGKRNNDTNYSEIPNSSK